MLQKRAVMQRNLRTFLADRDSISCDLSECCLISDGEERTKCCKAASSFTSPKKPYKTRGKMPRWSIFQGVIEWLVSVCLIKPVLNATTVFFFLAMSKETFATELYFPSSAPFLIQISLKTCSSWREQNDKLSLLVTYRMKRTSFVLGLANRWNSLDAIAIRGQMLASRFGTGQKRPVSGYRPVLF